MFGQNAINQLGYSIALQKCKLCKFARRELWTPSILKHRRRILTYKRKLTFKFLWEEGYDHRLVSTSLALFLEGFPSIEMVIQLFCFTEDKYFSFVFKIQICFFPFTVNIMDLSPTFQYIFSILDKIPTHY